ncbi:type III-B CRISPR module-associated protein Cmr3 [Pontibacter sp. G13]|uniref:type III-B CRISPR module-associated protein Cmr3 n=1 Tax=Pontibacter sp. G13 TaxID=3074898 RepID=UPI00288BDB94|nr:type III-B CRISPR module-associated protein Cmr3 [Pontibacter sp. G13]WNJ18624.1 type III-B CRISPR module-associated protein Cmr3 [Pontibacter sp. G13]
MKIFIEPFDTLFFKDGKPFSMGEDNWADGHFPPMPSVFYGALRSAYFSQNPNQLHLANEEGDPTQDLVISRIHVARNDKRRVVGYIPCPMDVVKEKNNNSNQDQYHILEVGNSDSSQISSSPIPTQLRSSAPERVEYDKSSWFNLGNWNKYATGEIRESSLKNTSKFLIHEPKIGIGRSRYTGSSEEGQLYRVGMKRMCKNYGFVVEFSGLDSLQSNGILKLGAEGKGASYHEIDKPFDIPNTPRKTEPKKVKMIFTTPAVFSQGWLPKGVDLKSLEGVWNGFKLKVTHVCVGAFVSIGGFNMKAGKGMKVGPKPMYRAIPAGSVFYVEPEDFDGFIEAFHDRCISEFGLSREGFGHILLQVV